MDIEEVKEELAILLQDRDLLPSQALVAYACDQGWIGVRHCNGINNLLDVGVRSLRQRYFVCEIQRRIFGGLLSELLSGDSG